MKEIKYPLTMEDSEASGQFPDQLLDADRNIVAIVNADYSEELAQILFQANVLEFETEGV